MSLVKLHFLKSHTDKQIRLISPLKQNSNWLEAEKFTQNNKTKKGKRNKNSTWKLVFEYNVHTSWSCVKKMTNVVIKFSAHASKPKLCDSDLLAWGTAFVLPTFLCQQPFWNTTLLRNTPCPFPPPPLKHTVQQARIIIDCKGDIENWFCNLSLKTRRGSSRLFGG